MSSLSKKVKEKVRLEMSKEMKLEAVFEDDEDECRKTADFVNNSLWNFLNVAEENGFDRYLMLTTMYMAWEC